MSVKLLNEHNLEFLGLKEGYTQAGLSLNLSKCHIVGYHMSRLNYVCAQYLLFTDNLIKY